MTTLKEYNNLQQKVRVIPADAGMQEISRHGGWEVGMLLRTVSGLVLLVVFEATACGKFVDYPKSKGYVLENLKHLGSLIQQKEASKSAPALDILFNEYVDDTRKLLEILDKQAACEQQNAQEDIVKQIAHSMAILQKLLEIMKNNQPEPLETYCHQKRLDALWGSLCGDRPTKRVLRHDEHIKTRELFPLSIKIHYTESEDGDGDLQPLGVGGH